MSRSIEFKYVFSNGSKTIVEVYSLDQIEGIAEDDTKYHAEKGYKLIDKLQFTGLLDCNGVKIFEGDRVSIFDTDDDGFMMCGVIKFGVRGYPAFDIYDDKNAPYSDDYNTLTNDEDFRFLVIGNIHQNSEQLK